MKEIVEKLRAIEMDLSAREGRFLLFSLFLRLDAPDTWDVVVAAEWVENDAPAALGKITSPVRESLTADELLKISKVAFVKRDHPSLLAMQQAITVEHGSIEVENSNFFGVTIQHAYVITCRRDQDNQRHPEAVPG